MRNSVFDNIKPVVSLVSATRTADANGTGVDTLGYGSAMLVVQAGDIDLASTDETYAINLEESADNSTFAAVSGFSLSVTADNQTKTLRIEGLGTSRQRYLRAVLDVGGTTPSIPASAVFLLGDPQQSPVGNS